MTRAEINNPLRPDGWRRAAITSAEADFFVGGVPKTTKFATSSSPSANYAQITVGQMYVEFQVPVAAKKWPIIVWHGSTHGMARRKIVSVHDQQPNGIESQSPFASRQRGRRPPWE
jgi:hypothetical protein